MSIWDVQSDLFFTIYQHCSQEQVHKSKVIAEEIKTYFLHLVTYWTCPHQQILCTSLALGGAAIIFFSKFEFFLGFPQITRVIRSLSIKNNIEPIFFIWGFTKTNFSSKFQFLEKMMAAPPRTKLVQRICWCGHVQYVSKVLKIGFVFFGNNFRVIYLFLGTVYNILNLSLNFMQILWWNNYKSISHIDCSTLCQKIVK